uniref:S1 RNA-binding domain-containing protein 1 n=1 Tax=Magallana gigas TaxID=29159 RepID=K1S2V2_MAGGI
MTTKRHRICKEWIEITATIATELSMSETHDQLCEVVQQKIFTVLTGLQKQNKLNTQIQRSIRQAESLTEVEDLYAPYKPGHKGTLAERARALNLEPVAMACIQNSGNVNLNKHIKLGVKGLSSEKEVQTGIQHIIADLIHRDDSVIKVVKDLCKTNGILIECSKFVTSKKLSAKTLEKAQKAQQSSYKFENYFEFKGSSRTIRPHQVLAINRGEEQKILTVKYTIPESIRQKFNYTAEKKYLRFECKGSVRGLMLRAIDDCWSRLVQPQIIRQIRSELTKSAQKSSIDVFSSNLRNLLLSAPFEILENDDDRKFINIEKMLDDNACAVSLTYYSKVPVKSRPVIRF